MSSLLIFRHASNWESRLWQSRGRKRSESTFCIKKLYRLAKVTLPMLWDTSIRMSVMEREENTVFYLAVQVLTKKESRIACMIEKEGERHGVKLDVFVPGKDVSKYDEKKVDGIHVAEIPGYVFVGFECWEDRLYRIIKDTYGVIRVLMGQLIPHHVWRKGDKRPKYTYYGTGIMSKDKLVPWMSRSEDEVAVEITEDKEELAERLKHQIAKCREFVEQKRTRTKRWLAVSVHLVKDLFDNATLEFLMNERGTGFRRIWNRLSMYLNEKMVC